MTYLVIALCGAFIWLFAIVYALSERVYALEGHVSRDYAPIDDTETDELDLEIAAWERMSDELAASYDDACPTCACPPECVPCAEVLRTKESTYDPAWEANQKRQARADLGRGQ